MKKAIFIIATTGFLYQAKAQETVYPVKAHKGTSYITNATVHVGNGQVIENATIKITDDKIEQIGTNITAQGGDVLDAKGKQVYPGLILSNTDLGLKEIANGVRGSNDYQELGELNPDVKSITAYNTASKIINVLRDNGILIANIVPEGGLLTGTSSVVQLDAWNYEDAVYKLDNGIHFDMPRLMLRMGRFGGGGFRRGLGDGPAPDPVKEGLDKIEIVKNFFREAKGYLAEPVHEKTNLKFEAVKGLFDKKQKFFIHCDLVKEMLVAVDFVKEFGFDVVIVGGSESYQMAPLLKQNNIAVILKEMHSLPTSQDDDVDQPFKTPAVLQKAGVMYAINDTHDESRYRNLPFNAGTAAAYGLTKEEALAAITLSPAKILGIADKTGSLEVGKDANIVISDGDILDMRTSIITDAYIQGRKLPLDDKQKELNERYKYKYGLK
jgi:imidazolonepropionase-like amidohydrolase